MGRRILEVVAFLALVGGCNSNHSGSHVEAPVIEPDESSVARKQFDTKEWTTAGIFPRVVHRHYFDAAGVADVATEPERFGLVRPLGNNLFAFLAYASGELIRNIHQEHLDQLKLSRDDANEIALKNLRKIAFDGSTIKQAITKTKTGDDWAVWLGNEFTSSCILLPEFYSWAKENLEADSFLVRVASTQLIFVLQYKDQDSLQQFDQYIAKVLEDSDNLVSEDWFVLTAESLTPLADE